MNVYIDLIKEADINNSFIDEYSILLLIIKKGVDYLLQNTGKNFSPLEEQRNIK